MILIKDMEMPNSCSECPLMYDYMQCNILGPTLWRKYEKNGFDFGTRLPECPLIEVKED